jgi:hypothetical protein
MTSRDAAADDDDASIESTLSQNREIRNEDGTTSYGSADVEL